MMILFRKLLDALLGRQRFMIKETQRGVVTFDGRFDRVLTPGRHAIRTAGRAVRMTLFDINRDWAGDEALSQLMRTRPELAEAHLVEFRTGQFETAALYRDGVLFGLMNRDARALLWREGGPWTIERFDVSGTLRVAEPLAKRLARTDGGGKVRRFEVGPEQVGVLFVDGVLTETLATGSHVFWTVGPQVEMKLVETRWMALEVTQQEMLTKDRVTIRVNVSATYRVTDPVRAVLAVKDFSEALYRETQLALRRMVGGLSLDAILAREVNLDAEATEAVRVSMAELGIALGEIAIKDVILPGEMRAILNQVVAVEKEAEANVIRRREETNATRALLNTAKVMEQNPVMLRLKELEALQDVAGRVDNLVIHNGTDGLMNDLVKLRG